VNTESSQTKHAALITTGPPLVIQARQKNRNVQGADFNRATRHVTELDRTSLSCLRSSPLIPMQPPTFPPGDGSQHRHCVQLGRHDAGPVLQNRTELVVITPGTCDWHFHPAGDVGLNTTTPMPSTCATTTKPRAPGPRPQKSTLTRQARAKHPPSVRRPIPRSPEPVAPSRSSEPEGRATRRVRCGRRPISGHDHQVPQPQPGCE